MNKMQKKRVKSKIIPLFLLLVLLFSLSTVQSQKATYELLWSYKESAVGDISFSSDGSYVTAWSGSLCSIFNQEGKLLTITYPNRIRDVAVSSDGSLLAVGYEYNDDVIYLFNSEGELLWNYTTDRRIDDVSVSSSGSYIAALARNNWFYLFNSEGELLWNYTIGRFVDGVSVSSDGPYIAAWRANRIYLFNSEGEILWRYETAPGFDGVSISSDGSYVAAWSFNVCTVYLFNSAGELLWRCKPGGEVKGVSVSSDGSYIAAGSRYGKLDFFKRADTPSLTPMLTLTSTPESTPIPIEELTPSPYREEGFKVQPTIRLRPVVDVIEKEQDGIVELYINNPTLNDVVLHLDVQVLVPAEIHIYSEQNAWTRTADGMAQSFEIPAGTEREILIQIMADENARIGLYNLNFSGMYYPGNNKDFYSPISLTYPIEVKEASDMEDILARTPTETSPTTSKESAGNKQVMLYGIITAVSVLCVVVAVKVGGKVVEKVKEKMERKRNYKQEITKYNAKLEQWKRDGYKVDELENMLKK